MTGRSRSSIVLPVLSLLLLTSALLAQTPGPLAPNLETAPLSDLAFDHVAFSVQDMQKMADWYVRVLGFQVARKDNLGQMVGMILRTSSLRLDLIKMNGSSRPPAPHPIFMQQGFVHLVLSVPDLTAARATLKALNTDVSGDTNHKDAPLVLHDPEGNEIELIRRP